MSDIRPPVTFCGLIRESQHVEVPMIQRDYAQGRASEKDLRNDFLGALHDALLLPVGDLRLPLNLDFVYGSLETGATVRFLPLDGQQRLTTLFLLHWYLSWRDDQLTDFTARFRDGKHSRFTYRVRPSSTEFFDSLLRFAPADSPDDVPSVRRMLEDQPWFFLHWRLDPTIQGVLTTLDDIHGRFRATEGLYARLVDDEHPAITFHLLPLEHFGLSDDLYIKMNARGKPLTAFETFKARFEELLKELFPDGTRRIGDMDFPVPAFFERRMDTRWTDFFWNQGPGIFDNAALNLVWALIRVSLDPASPRFAVDTIALGNRSLTASFTVFHDRNWLTTRFADYWMDLLEAWSAGGGDLAAQLPDASYFDEAKFLQRAIETPWLLTYLELVQFAAFVSYLTHHRAAIQRDELHQWMRVIRNLAANSDIERPDEFGRSLAGLRRLVPEGNRILERLADGEIDVSGFSPQQVREEALKARLILAHDGWRTRIETAESHAYFSGQIEFLLAFSGVTEQMEGLPGDWSQELHAALQASFDEYLAKTQVTFGPSGVLPDSAIMETHRWKRALLTVGDYLPSSGNNYSFLTNPQAYWDSWKRFLRGGPSTKRQYLKTLWDRIDVNTDIGAQLEEIIASATGLEPWRAAIVGHPEVFDYCKQQEIRREAGEEIYLLSKQQMSGYHAELFSYVLNSELTAAGPHALAPLHVQPYESVYGSGTEPHVLLVFTRVEHLVRFLIYSENGQFRLYVNCDDVTALPEVEAALTSEAKLVQEGGWLTRSVPRADIHEVLRRIAQSLAELPQPPSGHA